MKAAVCCLLALGCGAAAASERRVELSPSTCTVEFAIGHFLGANLVHGAFRDFSGSLVFDSDNPMASRIQWKVRAASLDTQNAQRDKQIRRQHYLNVSRFPSLSFQSTRVRQVDPSHLNVTGAFSLHGVTRSIVVPVVMSGHGHYDCRFTIARSDYGMPLNQVMAGNEVEIHLVVRSPRRA